MFNNAMLTDNQVRIARENKRICEEYKRYWSPSCTRDQMFRNIAFALQLPETTIASRINQMTKAGVKFPILQRKRRNSVLIPSADLNAIFADSDETAEIEISSDV